MTCPDCRTHKTGRCVSTVFAIVSIVALIFLGGQIADILSHVGDSL
jgi:hypothetical protein